MDLPENTEAAREYQDRVEAPDRNLTGEDLIRITEAMREFDGTREFMAFCQVVLHETPVQRLRRLTRHENLVKGLESMLLCRPLYGDPACDQIEKLLRAK